MERESHLIMKEIIKHKITHNVNRLKTSLKWVVFAILSGVLVGSVGTLFYLCMALVTLVRTKNPWLIFLLPVGGILIVGAYRLLHDERDTGTNLVLSAIHSGDELPLRMAPLIFISTLITHLFGGSAGREGAALQLGGSIGNGLGRLFHFDEKDKHIMIMCGMSAAFSALFGTPMAAAIFSMEVVSVGIMYYAALVPCVISSLIAHAIATSFGVSPDGFPLGKIPDFTIGSAVEISILAILCALVSILFCVMLHGSDHLYKKFSKSLSARLRRWMHCRRADTARRGSDLQRYGHQHHRPLHGRYRPPGGVLLENAFYRRHTRRRIQRRRDRPVSLYRSGIRLSVRKCSWIFADPVHSGWHVRSLLRRDKLPDHLAAHQL